MSYRIGIDVGGTNTDAVIVNEKLEIVAGTKTPTTLDVSSGIFTALNQVLSLSGISREKIEYAMLGTTHCTNAIVERQRLSRVGYIRIGKPATMAIAPMVDWPQDLVASVGSSFFITGGGHEFDGREITMFNEEEIKEAARAFKGNVDALAIASVFSPISADHEQKAAAILKELLGDIPITLSHEIASIGLLERENAAILNAALTQVARSTANGFLKGLEEEGITGARVYLCQNDGTLMSLDYAVQYPIFTVACGPTNSIRGASFLSGEKDALVLDVGGTTSDIGVIAAGFPRESSIAAEIGGVRTNFRMPDLMSIGLGGGTIIQETDGKIQVGPQSVGYRLTEEALVFGGKTLTATDIAVRLGMAQIGDAAKVNHISDAFAQSCMQEIMFMVNEAIDKMKLSSEPVPLVLVGGGSILIGEEVEGVSEIIRPNNHDVANAIGAAIAQVSGQVEKVYSLNEIERDAAMEQAKEIAFGEAVKAGADPATLQVVEVDDVPLAYLPGNATRIRIKAAGDLQRS